MKIDLNGKAYLDTPDFGTIGATIPGSVLSSLLEGKHIKDPFDSTYEYDAKEYLKKDYVLRKQFRLSDDDLKRHNYLCFDGIDTVADIYINENLIASVKDMHMSYRFLLDNKILKGENELKILFHSPIKYIESFGDSNLSYTMGSSERNNTFIRKAHYMFGWDWGPDLPDMGLYRDAYIDSTNVGYIDSFRHFETFNEDGSVDLRVDVNTIRLSDAKVNVSLFKDDRMMETLSGDNVTFHIENPILWMPKGYGNPELYTIRITLDGKDESCEKAFRVGLRDIRIDDSKDEFGRRLTVIVNGIEIMCKGSDYIPMDNILKRVNEENSRRLLDLMEDFNHNTIRIWGGGYYPDDYFYDICDEYGILIWQDLMFACAVYDSSNKDFMDLVKEETRNVLKRIRHHASIMFICGNNENETAIEFWDPKDKETSKRQYRELYIDTLKPIVEEETEFYYLQSSPTSNNTEDLFHDSNNDNFMDMHYWGVWHGREPFECYLKYYPRFLSEFGLQSFPEYKTIEKYAREDEMDIYSKTMDSHQKNRSCNEKILWYINQLFKEPEDFKKLVYLSQITQAEGVKMCVEHMRSNYPRCHGVMYWQINDCWPGQSWSSIDYFFNLKALHYYSRKFYDKYLVIGKLKEDSFEIHVSNDSLKDETFKVIYQRIGYDGRLIDEKELEVNSKAQSSMKVLSIKPPFESKSDESFIYLKLLKDDEVVSSNTIDPSKPKYLNLYPANIKIETIDEKTMSIESDTYTKNVFIMTKEDGAVLSDNFFDLLPNRKTIITSTTPVDFTNIEITCMNERRIN